MSSFWQMVMLETKKYFVFYNSKQDKKSNIFTIYINLFIFGCKGNNYKTIEQ